MFDISEMIRRIKFVKKEQKITNAVLARKTDIPLGTLNKILSGESKDPQVSAIIKISRALNVSADYIAFGKEPIQLNVVNDISGTDKQFINDYLNLSDQGKEYMLDTMDMVKDKYKKDILSETSDNVG